MSVTESTWFVGLDLGQAQDPSAFAVLERVVTVHDERDPRTFELLFDVRFRARQVQRIALGTPYPDVVARVASVARALQLRGAVELVMDATGVGRAVLDMMKGAYLQACPVVPVWITAGDAARQVGEEWRVPKRDLVAAVAVELQENRLQIAAGMPEAGVLIEELMNFKVSISAAGSDTYGSWREGAHDDMVLAVALALWRARGGSAGAGERDKLLFWSL
jgi:hypothetical protein